MVVYCIYWMAIKPTATGDYKMKTQEIANQIQATALVTRPQGSWKWQNAYAVSYCQARLSDNGFVVWEMFHRSSKMSAPQLARNEVVTDFDHGINRTKVSRKWAVKMIGERKVKHIENHGWTFEN